jgi:hypothetical protein
LDIIAFVKYTPAYKVAVLVLPLAEPSLKLYQVVLILGIRLFWGL